MRVDLAVELIVKFLRFLLLLTLPTLQMYHNKLDKRDLLLKGNNLQWQTRSLRKSIKFAPSKILLSSRFTRKTMFY